MMTLCKLLYSAYKARTPGDLIPALVRLTVLASEPATDADAGASSLLASRLEIEPEFMLASVLCRFALVAPVL